MRLPASRVTDMSVCPLVNPGPSPHVGGPIIPPCCPNVLTCKMPQARVGDISVCAGPAATIVTGAYNVLVGGSPAARYLDTTSHGGKIVSGCLTVLIGTDSSTNAEGSSTANATIQNAVSAYNKSLVDATDATLRNLPIKQKNDITEYLQKQSQTLEIKKLLRKMLKNTRIDKSFWKDELPKQKKLADFINSDKDIQNAKRQWSALSTNKKLSVMKKVADRKAELYGTGKIPITSKSIPSKAGLVTNGYYSPSKREITINTHKDSKFNSFSKSMNLISHEYAHHTQWVKADEFDAGKIPKSAKHYEQYRAFSMNRKSYVKGRDDYDAYRGQPVEAHSFATGSNIERQVK